MEDLIQISRQGVFSLAEARHVLPIIRRITQEISERVDALIAQLESTPVAQKQIVASLEQQINDLIHHWNEKIKKLGALPKGLWLVDFEFGRGYYCWKYPEEDLLYWHRLEDGFTGRRPLEDLKLEKNQEQSSTHSDRSRPDQLPSRGL
jgi:hypothetical protein